ncbi:Spy/CpxP family protein refolding chaperone [Legionella maioricensis]|uniref:Spy/CpxP family protein refolding chaperone n=1 Tax=Legionella maioricensis TaxID=2896528 RepID=A0A9X2IAU0_9GAMM|nr:Spy/CpxP family protein refolding chaperone [Legionella maioricensis]MCL9683661.1 Spy/CpxP family protein refolding chaperone [Legionella maioricensis]MCL9687683.1 Spy/CpxP family protein refolding chaperone [Legionella maioricensis]
MKKNLLWIVAVTFSFVLGQTAFANHCGEGMKKMVASFQLDATQKAKIMPILDQLKTTMQANWAQIKDIRMQINQQIQSDNMDQATVDGLIDKKTKLMSDMMKAKVNAKHQMYMLLNPQQKASYQNMVKKWQDKMASKAESCKEQSQDQDQE